MIAKQLVDVDTDDAVGEALGRPRGFIRANARGIAVEDSELAEDLEQEAGVMLWKLDPSRFDAADEQYVRGVLFKRMQKVARDERRARGGDRRVDLPLSPPPHRFPARRQKDLEDPAET